MGHDCKRRSHTSGMYYTAAFIFRRRLSPSPYAFCPRETGKGEGKANKGRESRSRWRVSLWGGSWICSTGAGAIGSRDSCRGLDVCNCGFGFLHPSRSLSHRAAYQHWRFLLLLRSPSVEFLRTLDPLCGRGLYESANGQAALPNNNAWASIDTPHYPHWRLIAAAKNNNVEALATSEARKGASGRAGLGARRRTRSRSASESVRWR